MSAPAPHTERLTGTVLGGHYRVGDPIGQGAMGVVYRVRHTLLHCDFAAKVLHSVLARDPEARRRFLREAEGLVRIHDPHIVSVRHFGEEGGLLYLVMDLCEGETLRDLLLREGRLPLARAVPLALQVLMALDAAHWEGVIHTDLKPANILITPAGAARGGGDRVRVVDFGLARVAAAGGVASADAPAAGTVAGTVAYMSPEQVRGAPDLDARSDIFSFGAVLHEVLAGRPPFGGEAVLTTALGILDRPPTPLPEDAEHGVPAPIRALIQRALEKDRERRFPTAAAAADALRRAYLDVIQPPAARPARAGLRRLLPAALLLALLGASLALAPWRSGAPAALEEARLDADRALAMTSFLDARFDAASAALARVIDTGRETGEDLLLLGAARIGLEDSGGLAALARAEARLGSDPRVGTTRARLSFDVRGGRLDAALRELDLVLSRGSDAEAHYLRAWTLHFLAGPGLSPETRPAAFESLAARMAEDVRALGQDPRRGVAEALEPWLRGDLARAREVATQAAASDPDLAEAAFVLAWINVAWGKLEKRPEGAERARRWFERGLASTTETIARARRRPDYLLQGRDLLRYWHLSCVLKNEVGDKAGAAADYVNEILGRNAGSRQDLEEGAQYLQWAGRFAQALSYYAAARAAGAGDSLLHGEGYCHMQLGRLAAEAGDMPGALRALDEAVSRYDQAEALDPEDPIFPAYRAEAWLTRARLVRDEASSRCLDMARKDFDSLQARGLANLPEVLFRRWEHHELLGERALALADIRAAIACEVDVTAAYYRRLSFSLVANASGGDARALLDEALQAAESAATWDPHHGELTSLLKGDALAASAQREVDEGLRRRGLAAARHAYAQADALAASDLRLRAEAHLRMAAVGLLEGNGELAVAEAVEALRLRQDPRPPESIAYLANDNYLRSPLAAFHHRLSQAYGAVGRHADAARERALATALR